ncbi:MAG: Wzz/FepE/Etk N-terminal domain-containing protein [Lachnospiraceae bacterium]|nr:Wzz/FepE/Etk N-terminal domain-containing protein [Lachnospiraceae bacterium]
MENRNDVVEIDLWEIMSLLLSRFWIILGGLFLAALATFLISHFMITPTYKSTTQIAVLSRQSGDNVTLSDMQLSGQLTRDYVVLIKSRFVLEQVIAALGLDLSYGELANNVNVMTTNDSRIVSITVTDTIPVRARDIADAIRDTSSEHITNVMNVEAVNVAEYANLPQSPSAPNVTMYTLIGAMAGAILAVGVILIRFFLDDSLKNSDDVTRYLELSTLAMVPIMENDKKKKKGLKAHDKQVTETFNKIMSEVDKAENANFDEKNDGDDDIIIIA